MRSQRAWACKRLSKPLLLLLLLVLPGLPQLAQAAELRTGESVVIPSGQIVNDDLYVSGGMVEVRGQINGDLVAVGRTVVVPGTVNGDVLAFGGRVEIQGTVTGTVRAAGGTVTLAGNVGRDAVIGGGTVSLPGSARVGRDVLLGASNATLAGDIGRNVLTSASRLALEGHVQGNVQAQSGQLIVAPTARLEGDLKYAAQKPAVIASGARIRGSVERTPMPGPRRTPALLAWWWLRAVIGLFLLGLALALLAPAFARRANTALTERPALSFGIGVVIIFLVPAAAAVIFMIGFLIGGWWLGLFVLAFLLMALPTGFVATAHRLGDWLVSHGLRAAPSPALATLIGLCLVLLLALLPIVGPAIVILATLFGLGGLGLALSSGRQRPHELQPATSARTVPPHPAGEPPSWSPLPGPTRRPT